MRIVALVDDLMDRTRVADALDGVEFVRDADGASGAEVVIVDLARHAAEIATIRAGSRRARIVAFGAHVDTAVLDRARDDGADVVVPRSRFFRDPAGAVE